MPGRGKRALDFDPLKSDSEDSDYDAVAARSRGPKVSKPRRSKPARKKQRTSYGGDGSEDISESELSEGSFEDDAPVDEPEPEVNPLTGRPMRKARQTHAKYEESDDDEDPFVEEPEASTEEKRTPKKKKKLIVKLNVKTPQPTRRSTRARSGSIGMKRPPTADSNSGGKRRSSRIAHDDTEPMIALTDSGHHADIVRPGTRSPDGAIQRAVKGGKGVKKPVSAIFEAEDESSAPTKEEPEDNNQTRSNLGIDREIAASRDDLADSDDDPDMQQPKTTDTQDAMEGDASDHEVEMDDAAVVPESDAEGDDDEDEDEDIVNKPRRSKRRSGSGVEKEKPGVLEKPSSRSTRRALRSSANAQPAQSSQRGKKRGIDDTSDFEPGPEENADENVSDSEASVSSPRKASQQEDSSGSNTRKSRRLGKGRAISRKGATSDEHESDMADELAEELEDLRSGRPRRSARDEILYDNRPQTRKRKPVDYRILRPDLNLPVEDDAPPSANTPSRKGRGGAGGGWQRSLFSTYGPFGGAGGPPPVLGGPGGVGAAGGADSDSSDDDIMQRPRGQGVGGTVGMTPTTGAPPGFGLFPAAQTHSADPVQGPAGTPANLGKIKDKQALADADPLGVDQNVNFDSVGGLQGHIDQLKEMVALPLLYPEVFQRFHVTPPRGVLFHGPPGTGKTLLARALASSVSSQGRKVTFYMRKGADALSKWVGEAERQLRLLFEEARKTQPSIIFFDEIDGKIRHAKMIHQC